MALQEIITSLDIVEGNWILVLCLKEDKRALIKFSTVEKFESELSIFAYSCLEGFSIFSYMSDYIIYNFKNSSILGEIITIKMYLLDAQKHYVNNSIALLNYNELPNYKLEEKKFVVIDEIFDNYKYTCNLLDLDTNKDCKFVASNTIMCGCLIELYNHKEFSIYVSHLSDRITTIDSFLLHHIY